MASGDLSERLIHVAVELFWEKGFAETNTRDIAEGCGVSPGAMYFYFKSKSELLYKVLEVTHARIQKTYLDAIVEAGPEPADQLFSLVRAAAWFHAAHRKEAAVAHREFKFLEPPYFEQIRLIRRHLQQAWEAVIQRGLDRGVFHSPGDAARPARQLTIAIANSCNQIAEWYDPANDMTPEALGDFYGELALCMVRART